MANDEFQHLTEECGHHCGAHLTGTKMYTGHCHCPECHGMTRAEAVDKLVKTSITNAEEAGKKIASAMNKIVGLKE